MTRWKRKTFICGKIRTWLDFVWSRRVSRPISCILLCSYLVGGWLPSGWPLEICGGSVHSHNATSCVMMKRWRLRSLTIVNVTFPVRIVHRFFDFNKLTKKLACFARSFTSHTSHSVWYFQRNVWICFLFKIKREIIHSHRDARSSPWTFHKHFYNSLLDHIITMIYCFLNISKKGEKFWILYYLIVFSI